MQLMCFLVLYLSKMQFAMTKIEIKFQSTIIFRHIYFLLNEVMWTMNFAKRFSCFSFDCVSKGQLDFNPLSYNL